MNFLMIEEIPAIDVLESSEEDEQAVAPTAGPPAKKVAKYLLVVLCSFIFCQYSCIHFLPVVCSMLLGQLLSYLSAVVLI
jgi:hypothetical protein